jgi:hypothetical protein
MNAIMEVELLREKLHEYINIADEQHLSAIYVLVEDNIPFSGEDKYDEATLKMLDQRRADHLSGKSKSYTIEETFEIARRAKK